jgi:hypothetical protein
MDLTASTYDGKRAAPPCLAAAVLVVFRSYKDTLVENVEDHRQALAGFRAPPSGFQVGVVFFDNEPWYMVRRVFPRIKALLSGLETDIQCIHMLFGS